MLILCLSILLTRWAKQSKRFDWATYKEEWSYCKILSLKYQVLLFAEAFSIPYTRLGSGKPGDVVRHAFTTDNSEGLKLSIQCQRPNFRRSINAQAEVGRSKKFNWFSADYNRINTATNYDHRPPDNLTSPGKHHWPDSELEIFARSSCTEAWENMKTIRRLLL